MREYFRENWKIVAALTLLVILTTALVSAGESEAQQLPEISELQVESYEMSGEIFEHTGEAIKPAVHQIVFCDEEGTKIIKIQDDFTSIEYIDNVECGKADIAVSVNGYQGTVKLKDAFQIQPAKVTNLQITQASRENIDLVWDKVTGAEGYRVYKSAGVGQPFALVQEISSGDVTTYQDTSLELNSTYRYQVHAYVYLENETMVGKVSESVTQMTPLATPALASVIGTSYNSILIQWNVVDGAVGYQVYRSLTQGGEYECIAEITDGSVISYTDTNCECGIDYYYYIKACQTLESGNVYGDSSEVMSAKTTPDKVGLSGTTTNGDTQVTLSWKKSAGAQGYEIYRSQGSASNYQLIADIDNSDTLTWSESGLDKDTVYYYRIRPYCVVNGTRIVGSYSGSYEKVITIVYNYSAASGEVSVVTQYAGKVQYVWGGKSISGWDCSGFTYWVYKNHFGIDIGTTTGSQYAKGTTISKNDRSAWKPGDLLFYTEGGGVSHVAIYLGNGQLIHALSEKYDTLIQDVDYYERWDRATALIAVKRIFN